MVQNTQEVAAEEEGQLDARLADLLHQMRDQHLEQHADYRRSMSRAAR